MESTESSIGVQQYWLILKRHWLPASAVFGATLALTVLSISLQKPIYEAQAKLSFKKTSPTSSITGLGKEIGEFAPVAEQSNPLTTEIEVIRSVPIIKKTLSKLNLKDEKNAPLKIKQFLKQLSVVNSRGTDILAVSYKDRNPEEAVAVVNTLIAIYIDNNQIVSRAEAVSARQFIEKQLPIAEAAVRQAEAALRRYKEQNRIVELQEEARAAVSVISDLDRQIANATSELADTSAQTQTFQNELRMNPQQGLAATSLSQSAGVQEALREHQQVERQLALERTRFQDSHPVIVDLRLKEATLKRLLQTQTQQVLGNPTQFVNSNLQIGEVKPRLIEEFVKTEAKRQGLAQQITALSHLKAAYQQRVNVLPKLEQGQRQLENRLQAEQLTYTRLLQKLQEIRIAENQNVGNARVFQYAVVPEEPVSSRKSLLLLSGVLLGSLFSFGTALMLEAADKSIRTVEEAKEVFGFTLLGVIPDNKKPKPVSWYNPLHKKLVPVSENRYSAEGDLELSALQVVVKDVPHSPTSAAYRMLQANLKFLSSDKDIKAIAVSSSLPHEGKSTVCANLAMTVAQLGRKVLLVDADLHCPVQHRIWELPNQVGLSNVIVGQEELRVAIAQVSENLSVLTAGVIPPNPMALLDSQRMAALIEKFSANYDLVLIDTPSLNVTADALILGKMADGILLVVRPGVVDSASASFAKELLEKSNQHVLGLVVNGVIPQNEPHSYYYFSNKAYAEELRGT